MVINKLTEMINSLRDLRDEQEEIACNKHESCICNRFDNIIDSLENLRTEFELNK